MARKEKSKPVGKAALRAIVDAVFRELAPQLGEGGVADYIPELARVDVRKLGIAIATIDGEMICCGDAIQSISKVFTLTMALGKVGDALWQRVGREPSGTSFNSIVQLNVIGEFRAIPSSMPGLLSLRMWFSRKTSLARQSVRF